MACCLSGSKPLTEPKQTYCPWTLRSKFQWNFTSKYGYFPSRQCIKKCCLQGGSHFCCGSILFKQIPRKTISGLASSLNVFSWVFCHRMGNVDSVHTLQWRHNERNGISNHQPHDCLLNPLFKVQIKENIKAPRHWPLCGEFTGDWWIPSTKGQNAKNFPFDDVIMRNKTPWIII